MQTELLNLINFNKGILPNSKEFTNACLELNFKQIEKMVTTDWAVEVQKHEIQKEKTKKVRASIDTFLQQEN